jgi:hypothetical protein
MRILALTALAMLWALSPVHNGAQANDDAPWCYRQFGAPQYSNCTYYSAHQCFLVARYSADGGICERNNRPIEPIPQRKSRHRSGS